MSITHLNTHPEPRPEELLFPKLVTNWPQPGERVSETWERYRDKQPGDLVRLDAADPGVGYYLYKVTRNTADGVYARLIDFHVRTLTISDVI